MIKDKLQIYLITYNRKDKLKNTLDNLVKSPIKDYDITILDNASTDGTSEIIEQYCNVYKNLKHIRHNVNIGGNANICRAFEMATNCNKDYCWILCDDDKYDFSNWNEVEEHIVRGDDIICVSDYVFNNNENKNDLSLQLFQLTFVPAGIYKISNITTDVLMNMYDSIITMFQQSCISIKVVNENKKIHVLSKPVVFNGLHFDDHVDSESLSYVRGASEKWLIERRSNTSWILGYSQILTLLKDKNLQQAAFSCAVPYKDIYGSWTNFYNCMISNISTEKFNYFYEIYKVLDLEKKKEILEICNYELYNFLLKNKFAVRPNLKIYFSKYIQNLFSITNTVDRRHKIITILGIKIKWKRKNKK